MSLNKWFAIAAVGVFALNATVSAQETQTTDAAKQAEAKPAASDKTEMDAKTLTEKASFMIGFEFMLRFKTQEIPVDLDQVLKGIRVAQEGGNPPMDKEEIQAVMIAFQADIKKRQAERRERIGQENLAKGAAYMKEFAAKEGVKKLDNGVLYEVLTPGSGDSPKPTDRVKLHYRGTLVSGDEFDSSLGGPPAQFAVGGVIKGFSAAIQAMKVGAKWKVVIPSELAYGQGGRSMGPNETLTFEIELLEIVK